MNTLFKENCRFLAKDIEKIKQIADAKYPNREMIIACQVNYQDEYEVIVITDESKIKHVALELVELCKTDNFIQKILIFN